MVVNVFDWAIQVGNFTVYFLCVLVALVNVVFLTVNIYTILFSLYLAVYQLIDLVHMPGEFLIF